MYTHGSRRRGVRIEHDRGVLKGSMTEGCSNRACWRGVKMEHDGGVFKWSMMEGCSKGA